MATQPAPKPTPKSDPPKSGFKFGTYKREIGFVAGILVALIVMNLNLSGLEPAGARCLALTLFAVIWWAFGVVHPGYTSLLVLVGYVLLDVAPPDVVFGLWTTPLIYIVVGGYLIAAAVQESGLGKRISYHFILKFVNSYTGVIVSAYVLGFLLSFFIPHPWPRSFLIMSVMAVLIKTTNLPKKEAANIGLAVFAGSASISMILLTGDSTINVVAASVGDQVLSWLDWFKYMGVPGIVASVLTCLLQLKLFKPSVEMDLDKGSIRDELTALGPMKIAEKKTLFWVILAVILWATDSLHHIHPGWIAALMALGLTLPRIGDVLTAKSWSQVPIGTMFFMTAAVGIGKIGAVAGMNDWVASVLLPSSVPTNPFVFAALASAVTIAVHMVLGSVMAVLGIVAPALILYASAAGWNPLVPSLLVYTAVSMHWILPFHHMNILVGVGESGGGYGDAEVAKLGIPLTIVVFIITMLVEIPWWKLLGLL